MSNISMSFHDAVKITARTDTADAKWESRGRHTWLTITFSDERNEKLEISLHWADHKNFEDLEQFGAEVAQAINEAHERLLKRTAPREVVKPEINDEIPF